jgi:hypothetical protein
MASLDRQRQESVSLLPLESIITDFDSMVGAGPVSYKCIGVVEPELVCKRTTITNILQLEV